MILNLRSIKESDLKALHAIHEKSVTHLAKEHYSKETIQAWTRAFQNAPLAQELELAEMQCLLAEKDKNPVGFALRHTNQIRALYVHPDFKGQKIGKTLLNSLEQKALAEKVTSLELRASLNAEDFYQSQGYKTVSEESFILPNGLAMACVKMIKKLL